jgi:hypothetical protein
MRAKIKHNFLVYGVTLATTALSMIFLDYNGPYAWIYFIALLFLWGKLAEADVYGVRQAYREARMAGKGKKAAKKIINEM